MTTPREPCDELRRDEPKKTAYRKPAVKVEQPSAQPEVLGGHSHVGCDVDNSCPGQDEAG